MRKSILFNAILITGFLTFLSSHIFPLKLVNVGVVDVEEVFYKYAEMTGEGKELVEKKKKFEEEIARMKLEIKALQQNLQTNTTLTEYDRQRLATEIDYKTQELLSYIKQANTQLEQLKKQIERPLMEDIYEAIKQVGIENGYTLILERGKSGVIYFDKEIDITSKVITKLKGMQKTRTGGW